MTTRRERQLLKALHRMRELHDILAQDTLISLRLLKDYADNVDRGSFDVWRSAFWVKLGVRNFMGHVDGVSYAMRIGVVDVARDLRLPFSETDLLKLEEKRRKSDGEVVPNLLPPDKSLKLAWRFFPALFDAEFKADTFGPGWQAFLVLKKVRNAFTHPDTMNDLAPIDGLPRVQPCVVWFIGEMARLFAECAPEGLPREEREPVDLEKLKGLVVKPPTFSDADHELISSSAAMSMDYFQHGVLGMIREVGWASDLVWGEAKLGSLHSPEGQFALRNLVRTFDSVLQGTTSFMRRYLLDSIARDDLETDEGEEAVLHCEGTTLEEFVATLNLWSRKVGNGKQVDERDKDYASFRRLLSRRDGLVHPKRKADLVWGADALPLALAASGWYSKITGLMAFNTENLPPSLERSDTPGPAEAP